MRSRARVPCAASASCTPASARRSAIASACSSSTVPAGVRRSPPGSRSSSRAPIARSVSLALEAGYRHIDTAEMYGNEKEVGEAVRDSGLDRSEVYVTSKLNNGFHRPDDARAAFDRTLAALGFEYVDLFLIHWPLP